MNEQFAVKQANSRLETGQSFDDYFSFVNFMYNDVNYKEADGIYIIYSGYVDLVDSAKRKCLQSLGMIEVFGDSRVLERVSYEQLGDLYAGLYPHKARKNAATKLLKRGFT